MESPAAAEGDLTQASSQEDHSGNAPVDDESDEEHLSEDAQATSEGSFPTEAPVATQSPSVSDIDFQSPSQISMDEAQVIVEQYEQDREEHIQLIKKLQELLRNVQRDRKALMQMTLEMQGLPSTGASEGTWASRHRQQLLGKYLCAKQLLKTLDPKDGSYHPDCEGGTAVVSEQHFTKKALPDWLMEDACPLTERISAGTTAPSKFVHPLRDMALHVERKQGQRGGDFELKWVPVKAKTRLVHKEELPVAKSQTTVTETVSAKASSASLHSSKSDSSKSESSPSSEVAKKEAQGVDALMGMMNLARPAAYSIPEPAPAPTQTTTTWTPPKPEESTPIADEALPVQTAAPTETLPVENEPQEIERSKSEDRPRFFFPQAPPQQQPVSSFFQMPTQGQSFHGQASVIAGGAAFGQSSFPQSDFGVSNVAPQLGSLGQMGGGGQSSVFNPSGFAGFSGGGFAAFAKQSTSFAADSNQTPPPQGGFLSGFQQTPSQGGSFGSGATGMSLFGSKPISKDDKLWEMRK